MSDILSGVIFMFIIQALFWGITFKVNDTVYRFELGPDVEVEQVEPLEETDDE